MLPSAPTYTYREVTFLLSLTHDEAIDVSVAWADSVGGMTKEDLPSTTSHEFDPVLMIARWHDVQDARRRVLGDRGAAVSETLDIVRLRLSDLSEREVAELVDVSPSTVHRRFHDLIDEIIAELDGERAPARLQLMPTVGELVDVGIDLDPTVPLPTAA